VKKAFLFFLLPFSLMASTVSMVMTVDWEGESISAENLAAIKRFREHHPEIAMLHFLNPAYYTKKGANADLITSQVNSVLRPKDEHGLHIHAWKSLVTYCGIDYKAGPSFGGMENCSGEEDCGFGVSLEFAYNQDELSRLVACSKNILLEQEFQRIESFRAGGWQLGRKMAIALATNGFNLDSSRTDANVLIPSWGADSDLVKMVKSLHPGASVLDQPYELVPGLLELPDNGCLADYTPPKVLLSLFQEIVKNKKQVMVIGFHQETASYYLPLLEKGIEELEKYASSLGIKLHWSEFPFKANSP
jgi:hypothetical protein